ncbi:iron-sulfur cluster biosynthesis family protein [Lactobacillus alvi]|uniref:Iron-sulfur cluster biosynthesis family protein n=1 Tax=Limosilactobacillus alvi TaxID=990412 RepID=A0ABS2ELP7_9LACO|nr:iron-sulfur cluster biosynthesis family protein [Limosilactobacillus alvi]MBM6753439.1 iron-sulfur cluster biosynthesis family protein [Limosilactobacillus alvi]
MKLTVTPAAQKRLAKYLDAGSLKRLILDFDDGVGPFSDIGDCSLGVNFKLILLDADKELPKDFDAHFASNLGDVYYKGYTKSQYAEHMKLDFEPNYFTMPLKSDFETLCDNVEVVDLTTRELTHAPAGTHDC